MTTHIPETKLQRPEPSWWHNTKESATFIIRRVEQRNLTQTASSLTFTTILALVPLLAVVLSLFTAFPLFNDFREALQSFLSSNLMPAMVSENVMDYLNEFAAKASSLTAIGSLFLIVTSIMLISTIDNTFNAIWLVTGQRPIAQRILVYWAIISLGPIVVGASLWASSILARESMGYIGDLSILASLTLFLLPLVLTSLAFSALFMYVPNRNVLWRDAFIGGVVTTFALEILKRGFAFYLTQFPTYTLIYGAFATLPIFLMWVYLSWLVLLLGASLVAILPSLRRRSWISTDQAGAKYINSISILSLLWDARTRNTLGLTIDTISNTLKRDPSNLYSLLEKLKTMGYVANTVVNKEEKWVLVCDPDLTPLAPLVDELLVDRLQADTTPTLAITELISTTVASPAITLRTLLANPDKIHLFSQHIQQQIITTTPRS